MLELFDATKLGLGLYVYKEKEHLVPIRSASRFLCDLECHYSINQLERLAVVW